MHMLKPLAKDQQGVVSIIVTAIIVVLLTLITVGFTKIIGREQRQTIDRQLSTQAFYAAETGVNDAAAAITNPDPSLRYTTDKTDCQPDGSSSFPAGSNQLDAAQGVEYSCLLIDQAPFSLEYGSIGTDASAYIPINGVDSSGAATNISRIRISWQDEQGGTTFAPGGLFPRFPAAGNWTSNTGVLRTSLTNVSGTLDRSTLINSTFTAFLYPQAGGLGSPPTTSYTTSRPEQGRIVGGRCNAGNDGTGGRPTKYCTVEITGLSAPSYFLRLKSIYANSAVTITAFDASDAPLRLARAQALVDSTGKANDVLRRIQVRVPARDDYNYPEYAIDSADSICKRLSVGPPDIASGDDLFDAACDL